VSTVSTKPLPLNVVTPATAATASPVLHRARRHIARTENFKFPQISKSAITRSNQLQITPFKSPQIASFNSYTQPLPLNVVAASPPATASPVLHRARRHIARAPCPGLAHRSLFPNRPNGTLGTGSAKGPGVAGGARGPAEDLGDLFGGVF
jgi:hypothetical protein